MKWIIVVFTILLGIGEAHANCIFVYQSAGEVSFISGSHATYGNLAQPAVEQKVRRAAMKKALGCAKRKLIPQDVDFESDQQMERLLTAVIQMDHVQTIDLENKDTHLDNTRTKWFIGRFIFTIEGLKKQVLLLNDPLAPLFVRENSPLKRLLLPVTLRNDGMLKTSLTVLQRSYRPGELFSLFLDCSQPCHFKVFTAQLQGDVTVLADSGDNKANAVKPAEIKLSVRQTGYYPLYAITSTEPLGDQFDRFEVIERNVFKVTRNRLLENGGNISEAKSGLEIK